ncbi:hypothetical protein BDA96_07G105600 [Sorghum bicolor]|uniref:Uncharacterized protein n=2 Tax=Sorghum bicolor TaxID=4558 RepID=A0A921UA52_SORBI|nr:hypothetical protein BDA96_07G105600 [Sorghum bicolor]OQU80243.1 hypothetical protein SORBI_3007G099133 [Sorghum bicolor]
MHAGKGKLLTPTPPHHTTKSRRDSSFLSSCKAHAWLSLLISHSPPSSPQEWNPHTVSNQTCNPAVPSLISLSNGTSKFHQWLPFLFPLSLVIIWMKTRSPAAAIHLCRCVLHPRA